MNDILYINGQIYTVDSSKSWAEAVAVKSGKITFVGTNDEAKSIEAKETVDLDGKMMLPGFIEAHGHVTWGAIDSLFKVSLFGADNVEFYIETIRKFVQENPELPVYEGAGWENPFFGKNGPSRKVLDEICSDKPMLMWSHDKHSLWVNTYVLDLCGIDKNTQVPAGNVIEREDDGTPSGTLREFAAIALVDSVKPVFNKEHYKKAIEWVQKDFAQYGVTSIMDPLLDPEDDAIAAIRELNDEGRLIC
ncbi:MAG: amidohydrolase, partial [Lentihominibacter sp.]